MENALAQEQRAASSQALRQLVTQRKEILPRSSRDPLERGAPHGIVDGLGRLGADGLPVVWLVHPRVADKVNGLNMNGVHVLKPQPYLETQILLEAARVVITDSGGLQKEAAFHTRPCVTVRTETEWVETVHGGGNKVTGTDGAAVQAAVDEWLDRYAEVAPDFGAAAREHFGEQVFRTVIPRNVRLSEAPSHGKPALLYDINS